MLRSYRVFNLEQTQDCKVKPLPPAETTGHDPIELAEAIIAGMPNPPQMEFYENANYVPHYQPATDVIRVPKMSRYLNLEDYYNTVFHELTHATGHSKRLDRFSQDANADGLHAYGREELTAAMGSAMLAAHAGIEAELVERDASYIRHWRDTINADKPMIIRSASLAQKAVDLILGEKPPEFLPDSPQPQPDRKTARINHLRINGTGRRPGRTYAQPVTAQTHGESRCSPTSLITQPAALPSWPPVPSPKQ